MQHSIRHSLQVFHQTRVFERPDGYYWQSDGDGPECGPFVTMLLAVEDMQQSDKSPADDNKAAVHEIESAYYRGPDTTPLSFNAASTYQADVSSSCAQSVKSM